MTFLKTIALPRNDQQMTSPKAPQSWLSPAQHPPRPPMFSQRTEVINLLKQAEKGTKNPILDPFGWNKPSLHTLSTILIYGLNLFYNSVNFSEISLEQDSNLTQTYPDSYRKESASLNLYAFTGNTLGILALGILYSLHKIEKINKDHTITMVPQNIKNLLYLPMLINTILEIVLRIKNQPIDLAKTPLLNTITPCINSGALILKTFFYTMTLLNALELSAQNAVYGVASHRVLSKLKEILISLNPNGLADENRGLKELIKTNQSKSAYIVLHMVAHYLEHKLDVESAHTPDQALDLVPDIEAAPHGQASNLIARPQLEELESSSTNSRVF